ncbi:MAG: MobF family relaxase [Pirellulaceae bacterium]
MLRIIQNRSANSAKSYYSHAEYYGESQELTGTWHGNTAEMLGLTGEISQCDFDAMCDNLHPRTGEPLTARTNRDRTVGYDFNFHVPKGVSLAYAFGDERIGDVFARAVNETMEEIEAEAKTRVRTSGRQEERLTRNLAWGTFIHKTARPVEGEPDCHLHAHCFVFNATHDPDEDRFKAVQFRDLKRDAGYFEARFHARFAKALKNELGYDIRRQGRQWDIAAIPESMVRKFSRRTEQIEREADARGDLSAEDKANIAAETCESKNKHQSMEELREIWRNRLSEGEQVVIDSLPEHRSRGQAAVLGDGPASVEEAVKQAVLHCFERDAVVPYRKVLAEAMRVGVANLDIDDVAAEAGRQGVIAREVDGRFLATTRDVLRKNKVLEFARQGRHASTAMNPHWRIERDWMSDEQKEAIQTLIHSEDRVQLILGGAGTGKTTLMSEAVAAIEAGGHEVFTFAPSARASRDVLRNEGFENATTVAELLVSDELKNAVAGNVIWIDEAGLLGSRQLKQVFDIAEQGGSRVILSGDWKRQHGSVDRGGVLGLLDRYAGVTPIQVNTIRRQQGRYKEAINSMSEGDLLRGFDQLDELGWVHEIEDEDRDQRIAGDFADVVENKGSGAGDFADAPAGRTSDRRHSSRTSHQKPADRRRSSNLRPGTAPFH